MEGALAMTDEITLLKGMLAFVTEDNKRLVEELQSMRKNFEVTERVRDHYRRCYETAVRTGCARTGCERCQQEAIEAAERRSQEYANKVGASRLHF